MSDTSESNDRKGFLLRLSAIFGGLLALLGVGISVGINLAKIDALSVAQAEARQDAREYTDQRLAVIQAQYTEIIRRLDKIERAQ